VVLAVLVVLAMLVAGVRARISAAARPLTVLCVVVVSPALEEVVRTASTHLVEGASWTVPRIAATGRHQMWT